MPNSQSNQTAKIVEWHREKGYGFLEVGRQRVFLHASEFTERHKAPAVGDKIQFDIGEDERGRVRAKNAIHVNDDGRLTLVNLTLLLGLLVLPAIALLNFNSIGRWMIPWIGVISALTYWTYAYDKRLARTKEHRVPEFRLHILALLGGLARCLPGPAAVKTQMLESRVSIHLLVFNIRLPIRRL